MQKLNSRIAELEAQIKDLEKTNEFLNSFLAFVPLHWRHLLHLVLMRVAAALPVGPAKLIAIAMDSGCGSSTSIIEETLKSSSIGPTLTKRKVAHECRKVTEELDGVLAKYHESLACVLGNTFLYGDGEEKTKGF